MSLRDLASAVGIQAASVYNHVESKETLLASLLLDYTQEMLDGLDVALNKTAPPAERLRSFVSFHICFHTRRLEEASICVSELRHLRGPARQSVLSLRDQYEQRLCGILRDGLSSGDFNFADEKLAAFAILGMITSVIGWYRRTGSYSPKEIANSYSVLALRMVGER
jgi:AcrR family transcriptional regulator